MAEKKIPPTPVTVTVPTTAKLNFAVSLGSVELGAGGTPPPSDTTPPAAAARHFPD
jgi:hypothetical protein